MNIRINSQLFHTFFKKNICTKNWKKVTDTSTQSLISFLVFFYYLYNLRRPFIYDLPSKIDISSAFSLRKISFCQCIVHVQQQPASGPSGISFSSFQAWMIFAALLQCISHLINNFLCFNLAKKKMKATFHVTVLDSLQHKYFYMDFETPRYLPSSNFSTS